MAFINDKKKASDAKDKASIVEGKPIRCKYISLSVI